MSSYYPAVPQASASDISEQLRKEEDWLSGLEANLEKSRNLKNSMIGILDSFEQRLSGMESTVLPLYEHTAKLQTRQKNLTKALKSINKTLEFHQIANEMDSSIRDSDPSQDLKGYLAHMDKLREAMTFFAEDPSRVNQLDYVKSSYEFGCTGLEREFKDILRRNSSPVVSSTVIDAISDNFDVIPERLKLVDLMAHSSVESLKKIGKWLSLHAPSSDYLNVYAEIRSGSIMRSLKMISDSQKSASLENPSNYATPSTRVAPSPKVDRKFSTPVTKNQLLNSARFLLPRD